MERLDVFEEEMEVNELEVVDLPRRGRRVVTSTHAELSVRTTTAVTETEPMLVSPARTTRGTPIPIATSPAVAAKTPASKRTEPPRGKQAEKKSEPPRAALAPLKPARAATNVKGKKTGAPKAGGKRKRKQRMQAWVPPSYINKVLKQVHPSTGISRKAMDIMSSFMDDSFERIALEAGKLVQYNKKGTLASREIQTAVRLVLPGELAKHAVSEGTKAVTKFTS